MAHPKVENVAIVGGSGYGAAELLRILSSHPRVKVVRVLSRSNAGKEVADVHPNLRGFYGLKFSGAGIEEAAREASIVFFATPHKVAMGDVPKIVDSRGVRAIIDLSGDFRLKDPDLYRKYYKATHEAVDLLPGFVYGLPETNRALIRRARCLASPGCFPTGSLLALLPLAERGLLKGDVVVDAKTGSSGSGVDPSPTTHHPERAQDFRAYKMFEHQHEPEIVQCLRQAGAKDFGLTFIAHSAPMVRGIFTTAYVNLDMTAEEVRRLYRKHYRDEKFVRVVNGSPRCSVVAGTNFCDIGVAANGRKCVVMTAIDNLVKGGAGQAVQSMNIMRGFDETEGLWFPGTRP